VTAPHASPAKILLVDDRPENLLALEAILQGLGHVLLKASSGEEALKRLLAEDVALILLDVQMPGMDGFETATHIKQRERTRDVPIVFLTAIDGEAHQAFRGYAAGAVDYLSKPFDPWVLRAKVGVFIELFERRRELSAQAEDLRQQLARSTGPDVQALLTQALEAVVEAQRSAADSGVPLVEKSLTVAAAAVAALQARLGPGGSS
jgi:CheY-like chemotaxis protein